MRFKSTRTSAPAVSPAQALLSGLAPDGGLYVPLSFPRLDGRTGGVEGLGYAELERIVLGSWFEDLAARDLAAAVDASVRQFDNPLVAPLSMAGDLPILELFHGPTLAFKDLALTLFGDLLALARRQIGIKEDLLVIVATSGDTGSAALAGLENRPGVRVVALYPAEGISEVQRRQMTTRTAENCLVLGLRGNFDDAQRIAKRLLSESSCRRRFLERGHTPCSANSINVGRLVPQIVYYVHGWRQLRAAGLLGADELFDVSVPSGNFGNVLAARYAKYEGLPLDRLHVATNRNRVLADFLQSGTYDRNRPFHVTTSPSMDILVSSNLERMLYEAVDRSEARVAELMAQLSASGSYSLSERERGAFGEFDAVAVDDAETAAEIGRVFSTTGYLLDPHSATASVAARRSGARNPVMVLATASPFKFANTVARAIGLEPRADEFDTIEALADRAGLPVPERLRTLRNAPERQRRIVEPTEVEDAILDWLAVRA